MKKIFFAFALMLMALGMSFTVVSCSSDEGNETRITIREVQSEVGVVFFDEGVGKWYIYCVQDGTVDSAIMYFPLQIEEDVKKIGTYVRFSGKVYKPDFPKTLPAGTSYYLIDINCIEIIESI
jgi:hypothetical protein